MPSYTLYYFNQRGRAEICRMLFAAADIKYKDKRIESSEWNNMKINMPGSMVPMLDIDNEFQIPQTMAIARYLAREYGFHGNNNIDMARVDYISDCFYDILDDYLRMYQDKDGRMMFQISNEKSSPSERRIRYLETIRRILPFMERTLEMYDGGNAFFMGKHMTMADMMCFCALETPIMEDSSILGRYPKLTALRKRVINHLRCLSTGRNV